MENILKRFKKFENWPTGSRGNIIHEVKKILDPKHLVNTLPPGTPKIYYSQRRENLNVTRVYRDRDISDLPDGSYLYLIEFDKKTETFHKYFVKVLNLLESGSRHFQLPTGQESRVIVLAGELRKENESLEFNLESGTYTQTILKKLSKIPESKFVELMSFIFHTNIKNYTKKILVPQTPGSLNNLRARGKVTFDFINKGKPTLTKDGKTAAELLDI